MFLQICEHPLRIKKDGHYRYVPCGKCNTCLNHRSSETVQRLQQESRCWKYTIFFTLTYADNYLPTLDYDFETNCLCDLFKDEYYSLDDIKDFKPSSRLYLNRRRNIPYLRVKDVQDFMKRLRFYVSSLTTNTYEHNQSSQVRYYIVGEYGPTTFRPHYHGLLFFSSDLVGRDIRRLIFKAWPYGRVDVQYSEGKSHEYCARYINCVSALPKVYCHRSLRPFSVSSKGPSIGSLAVPTEKVSQLFFGGYSQLHFEKSDGKVCDVSVWRSLEGQFFPKVARFSDFSHNERVTLYGVSKFCPIPSFSAFVQWCKELSLKYDTFLSNYLYECLYRDASNHPYENDYSCLKRLYYTSTRVVTQARVFGVSLDFYVSRIEEYYSTKELYKLKQFYQFQEVYTHENQTSTPLLFAYPDAHAVFKQIMFDPNVREHFYFLASNHYNNCYVSFFDSIGIDVTAPPMELSNIYDSAKVLEFFDTSRFTQLNARIIERSRKRKKRNDYVENHKKDFTFNIYKRYE